MNADETNKLTTTTARRDGPELRSSARLGRCATCKWWGDEEDKAEAERLRRCNHPKTLYGYGVDDEEVPADGWHCEDDEGWGCQMGQQFGCVNHEAA